MIWSSTATGHIVYASPEWTAFTGQTASDAVGNGWLSCLHPDDVAPTKQSFREALAHQASFTIRYRLRHVELEYIKVVVAAMPSFSPIDGAFIGYIGVISEADGLPVQIPDGNVVGYMAAVVPGDLTRPTIPTDAIADYLLLARATAVNTGVERMLPSLDFAISEIMREIGKNLNTTIQ